MLNKKKIIKLNELNLRNLFNLKMKKKKKINKCVNRETYNDLLRKLLSVVYINTQHNIHPDKNYIGRTAGAVISNDFQL